jgi:hypothetical protein
MRNPFEKGGGALAFATLVLVSACLKQPVREAAQPRSLPATPDGATASTGSRAGTQSLTPDLPRDVTQPITQQAVNAFAWQMFVAVNWPAQPGQRGVADPTRMIGEPGPTVWLTYKAPEEVFVAPGSTPAGWNVQAQQPPGCNDASGHVLVMDSKASDFLESTFQAVGGTLADQRDRLARYEIRFDKTSFDYIVGGKLYDAAVQRKARSISFPTGALEVKAAWREMAGLDDTARKRFYRTTACICDPPAADGGNQPVCRSDQEVGLVGLHIIQKTPSATQWIWSTFEQVDNVVSGAIHPSFNNPECPPTQCVPNKSTEGTGRPTQVTRVTAIPEAVRGLNAQWQARLAAATADSPWQYYELINTQWPTTPDDPTAPLGNPEPNLLANITMETYIQLDSSCMGCHSTATTVNPGVKSDFSFLFLHTQGPSSGGTK